MIRIYERDTGPDITGSGRYIGLVFPSGPYWVAEQADGSRFFLPFATERSAVEWLRDQDAEERAA